MYNGILYTYTLTYRHIQLVTYRQNDDFDASITQKR